MRSCTGIISLLFIVLCVQSVLAQGTCPDLVDTALTQASEACADLGRNQACYGNISLEAQAREGVSNFTFTQQGDIANLIDIQHLTLEAMDVTNDTWGIALLKLQANLPDTAPGQNVTMVMFGNVEVEAAQVTVSASNNANVRAAPSTNDAVVGTISGSESVNADGRLDDSSWLRVRLTDDTAGWVRADLVTTTGEVNLLPVVTAEDVPFTPLQAFYFATALGDAPCEEAPDSGILIQSPQGAGEIELTANGVNITLGSTAYLQAQPGTAGSDGVMTVSVVEGQGVVEAGSVSVTIPAGTQATIPLDENGMANGAPQGPVPYNGATLNSLPIILLPETIAITGSSVAEATAEATEVAITVATAGTYTAADLVEGEWTQTIITEPGSCMSPNSESITYQFYMTYDTNTGFQLTSYENGSNYSFEVHGDGTVTVTTQNIVDYNAINTALGTQSGRNPGEMFDLTINSPTSITLIYSFPYADTSCGEFVQTSTFTVGHIEADTGIVEYVPGSWTMNIAVDYSCASTEAYTLGSASAVVSIVKEEGFPYHFLTPDDLYDNQELIFLAVEISEVINQLNNLVMEYMYTITLTENTSTSITGTLVGSFLPDCPTGSFTLTADE